MESCYNTGGKRDSGKSRWMKIMKEAWDTKVSCKFISKSVKKAAHWQFTRSTYVQKHSDVEIMKICFKGFVI